MGSDTLRPHHSSPYLLHRLMRRHIIEGVVLSLVMGYFLGWLWMQEQYAKTPMLPPTRLSIAAETLNTELLTTSTVLNGLCHELVDMRGGTLAYRTAYCDGPVPRMRRTMYR